MAKRWVVLSISIFVACFGLVCVGAFAEKGERGVLLVRQGHLSGRSWAVEVLSEVKSICLEISVVGKSPIDESGRGQCSYPAVRRGILLVVGNRQMGRATPRVMAVGGGFNPAVKEVVARMFDGSRVHLPLFRLSGDSSKGSAGSFKYVAFAVRGPWCAQAVTSYNRSHEVLWRTNWREFDSAWRDIPTYNPGVLCRE
jgi:hypothetical protein